jgi:hypothetical protein
VDRVARRVTITSFYETNDAPEKATVSVLRKDGSVVAEGPLDQQGRFVFSYDKAEPFDVIVRAPGGHRASCAIAASALEEEQEQEGTPAPRGSRSRDLLLGCRRRSPCPAPGAGIESRRSGRARPLGPV